MKKSRVFLVQVNRPGSITILKEDRYVNEDWQSRPKNRDHGKVKTGDRLLVYFAKGSINFKGQLRRIYRVINLSEDHKIFNLKLQDEINPLTRQQIQKYVNERTISKDLRNCGQPGFNIREISEEDFEKVLQIAKETSTISRDEDMLTHQEVEALLLRLGNMLGFDTYTADKSSKTKDGEELENLSTVKEVPLRDILDIAKEIDVIWFKDKYPKYCFEVEHTTDITKGLLRLYHVRHIAGTSFFVIAPSSKLSKFDAELRKDPFNQIKERYIFKTYTELLNLYDSAKKFLPLKASFGIQ